MYKVPKRTIFRFTIPIKMERLNRLAYTTQTAYVECVDYHLGRIWCVYAVDCIHGHYLIHSHNLGKKEYAELKGHIQNQIDRLAQAV